MTSLYASKSKFKLSPHLPTLASSQPHLFSATISPIFLPQEPQKSKKIQKMRHTQVSTSPTTTTLKYGVIILESCYGIRRKGSSTNMMMWWWWSVKLTQNISQFSRLKHNCLRSIKANAKTGKIFRRF